MEFEKKVNIVESPPLKSSLAKYGRYESEENLNLPTATNGHHKELSKIDEVDKELMKSLQLGFKTLLTEYTSINEVNRDLLMMDFSKIQYKDFPEEGSTDTPPHSYVHFSIKAYAPLAFFCFRDMLGVKPDEFITSVSSLQILEQSKFGVDYKTKNNKYIIKNVHKREKSFLLKFLPAYYMNLTQNSKTLLPHFYGIYRYQDKQKKTLFFIILNNMFPNNLDTHIKFKLKGSIPNRKKVKKSFLNQNVHYTDYDFVEQHPKGLFVSPNIRRILLKTIRRDCLVLQSNNFVGYSLMIGLHTMDPEHSDKYQFYIEKSCINFIPARTYDKKEILLSIGFVDILHLYCLRDKIKVTMDEYFHQSIETNHLNPSLYAEKFRKYFANNIVRKDTCFTPFKYINYLENTVGQNKTSTFATLGGISSTLGVPVPKFGEKLSPCNVSDWLQVHEAFNIINIQKQPSIPLDRVKKLDRRVSFKYLSKLEERNDHLDFTTQSVMSMQGSIFRGFQPLQLENNTRKNNKQRNGEIDQNRHRTKKEYFEYLDYVYAMGENNIYEDNIILSLYSIFEAKKEMTGRPTKKIFNSYVSENETKNELSNQELQQKDNENVTAINIPQININIDF